MSNIVLEYLVPVIGGLCAVLLGYLVGFIAKHLEKLKNDTSREAFSAALTEAHVVGRDAILATRQKFVDDLKAASEDGKLTKEEAAEALATARLYFNNHISRRSKDVLKERLGSIHEWLDNFLEARLGEYKGEVYREVGDLANPPSPELSS
jgi:hypothetical protein